VRSVFSILGNIHTIASKFSIPHKASFDLIMLELGANDIRLDDGPFAEAFIYSLLALQPQSAIMLLTTVPRFQNRWVTTRYEDLVESKIHFPLSRHLTAPLVSLPYALYHSPARNGSNMSLILEGKANSSSPLFGAAFAEAQNRTSLYLWPDGSHLSSNGHALCAAAIAVAFLEMMPRVRWSLRSSPTLTQLLEHSLFPAAKQLTDTNTPLMVRSFTNAALPKDFSTLPNGWQLVNERGRFGIAAFAQCNQSRATVLDPCSDPLLIQVGGPVVVIELLRSYVSMGMFLVQAPPQLEFDICEFPLNTTNATCVIDAVFPTAVMIHPVSIPWHVKMRLVPKDNRTKMVFPMNLSLHVVSPTLTANMTHGLHYNNEMRIRLVPPIRDRHKVKLHGWYSKV